MDEKAYITPPKGYDKAKEGHICRLKRSLYGFKHISRQWNIEFTKHLHLFGFIQSQVDNCLFTHSSDKGSLILIVYVNDLLFFGTSKDLMHDLKQSLHTSFTIKDLGQAK